MAVPRSYESELHASFDATLREAGAFFVREGRLHETVHRLAMRLADEQIDYALVGGMALGEYGYVRMTEGVDVILTPEGFRARLVGRGYVPTHEGATRAFRDAASGVRIEILVSGDYPGDGGPKAVSFPNPAEAAIEVEGIRVLSLARVIELKLASGMSAPHRLRDLADVQEVIKARGLGPDFALQLDPSVRAMFLELQRTAAAGEQTS